jgi:fumarylacetoacetase
VFGPSRRLDYELELGVWIGPGNALGEPIPIHQAEDAVAGYCLLNDWSARDLQAWEYQPLGPFLAKNFLTSVSPFVITPEAMAPFMVAGFTRPEGDPAPLPYLSGGSDKPGLGLTVGAALTTQAMRDAGMAPHRLSQGQAADAMYWTVEQIIAHHSSNGCNLQPGDLIGTGTLSTATADGLGSLLEISKAARSRLRCPPARHAAFLEDGDDWSDARARRRLFRHRPWRMPRLVGIAMRRVRNEARQVRDPPRRRHVPSPTIAAARQGMFPHTVSRPPRRPGLGSAIAKASLEWARAKGCQVIPAAPSTPIT